MAVPGHLPPLDLNRGERRSQEQSGYLMEMAQLMQ